MYEQLANDLRAKIRDGKTYPPGAQLPSTRELCAQYGVSETVVRFAMQILRFEGLIEGQQGKGVFVRQELPPEGGKKP